MTNTPTPLPSHPAVAEFLEADAKFKAIHQSIDVDEHSDSTKGISWVSAHIYVIDIFLWYMVRRGYTLQRTNKRGEFRSLSDDVTEATERRTKSFAYLIEGKQP